MGVVLTILKVLGLILLWIVIILLAILLIILITPFHYEVKGGYHKDSEKPYDVNVKFFFWLKAVHASFSLDPSGHLLVAKLIGIPVFRMPKKGGEEEKPETSLAKETELEKEEEAAEVLDGYEEKKEEKPEETSEKETETAGSSGEEKEEEAPEKEENAPETEEGEEAKDEAEKPKKEKKPFEIEALLDTIETKKTDVEKKIHKVTCIKDRAVCVWNKDSTQHTVKLTLRIVKKAVKHILPRKGKVSVVFGDTNPQTVGMVCMYSGIAYPFVEPFLSIRPVFDEDKKEVEGELAGKVVLGYIVLLGLRWIICPDNWKTIKYVKMLAKMAKA